MPYQTFPWERGDSLSANKLVAIDLPRLKDKTVLDIGCNSGFFCGFAAWQGARKVVGVDAGQEFIETARTLFPQCEFRCQDWMSIGDEKYDVIIFISAIHYAPDQQAMLDFLMQRLNPGGVLVLEVGIAPGGEDRFVEVKRSLDSRFFPTLKKLESMFGNYAAKRIGPGIPQAGDPLPRAVYHIRHKLPLAILVMDEPRAGKTTISTTIFRNGIKRVSGDDIYYAITGGKIDASPRIRGIIAEWSTGSLINCAAVTYKICREGLLGELCAIILAQAGCNDFILDMYVTPPCRENLRALLDENNYFVVDVSLYHARRRPPAREAAEAASDCQKYMDYLRTDFLVNEEKYLKANPDVAKAIEAGIYPNAQYHYWHMGRKEGRSPEKD